MCVLVWLLRPWQGGLASLSAWMQCTSSGKQLAFHMLSEISIVRCFRALVAAHRMYSFNSVLVFPNFVS